MRYLGTLMLLIWSAFVNACASDEPMSARREIPVIHHLGAGLSLLGGGIQELSILEPKLPEHYEVVLSAEQRAALEQDAVELPHEAIESTVVGFGAGYGQPIAAASLPILQEMERLAGRRFHWFLNPSLMDIAFSAPGDVVILNPNRMGQAAREIQLFFLLHEVGHHVLRHTSPQGVWTGSQAPWLIPAMELHSDCFAVLAMRDIYGFHPYNISYVARVIFANNPGDQTHPQGAARIQNIDQCVNASHSLSDFVRSVVGPG